MLEVLGRIDGLIDQAGGHAVVGLSDQDLTASLRAAHVVEQRIAAIKLVCVREIDGRGLTRQRYATSTAAWLREQLRISSSAARRMVRLAAAVADAPPVVGEALAGGAISVEQTWVIVQAVADLSGHAGPEVTKKAARVLVDHAGGFDPLGLRRIGERVLWHVSPDLAEAADLAALRRDERRAQLRRHLTLSSPDSTGQVRLTGMLDAETAGLLHAAIDPLSAPAGDGDDRTPGQRRHDALAEVCRLVLGTGDLPESGGDRPQIVVTVGYDLLARRLGAGTLDTGLRLTPETVRRLACDAAIMPAVLGGSGQVLDVGRQRRLFTGPLRRALVLRDRGCGFPGCDRPPRWCAGHHIQHWQEGGATSLDNAVLLCGQHHTIIHHGQWRVRLGADGHPEFIPPAWLDPAQLPRRNVYHLRT